MSNWYIIPSDKDLMHHGVKNMKWGHRKGSVYQSGQNTNTASKSGSVARDNNNTIIGVKGQVARLLRFNKITDKQINDTAKDWHKLSKLERSILLNLFKSNNPKAYRKLVTAIMNYNKKLVKR